MSFSGVSQVIDRLRSPHRLVANARELGRAAHEPFGEVRPHHLLQAVHEDEGVLAQGRRDLAPIVAKLDAATRSGTHGHVDGLPLPVELFRLVRGVAAVPDPTLFQRVIDSRELYRGNPLHANERRFLDLRPMRRRHSPPP